MGDAANPTLAIAAPQHAINGHLLQNLHPVTLSELGDIRTGRVIPDIQIGINDGGIDFNLRLRLIIIAGIRRNIILMYIFQTHIIAHANPADFVASPQNPRHSGLLQNFNPITLFQLGNVGSVGLGANIQVGMYNSSKHP